MFEVYTRSIRFHFLYLQADSLLYHVVSQRIQLLCLQKPEISTLRDRSPAGSEDLGGLLDFLGNKRGGSVVNESPPKGGEWG